MGGSLGQFAQKGLGMAGTWLPPWEVWGRQGPGMAQEFPVPSRRGPTLPLKLPLSWRPALQPHWRLLGNGSLRGRGPLVLARLGNAGMNVAWVALQKPGVRGSDQS